MKYSSFFIGLFPLLVNDGQAASQDVRKRLGSLYPSRIWRNNHQTFAGIISDVSFEYWNRRKVVDRSFEKSLNLTAV